MYFTVPQLWPNCCCERNISQSSGFILRPLTDLIYIQVHLNKLEYHKKVNIFVTHFTQVKPIYYIDALHIEWKMLSLYFLKFWWFWLINNENPKFSVSEILCRILHKINKKRDILNRNFRLLKSMFITQYLVGPPFAWIIASMQRGMETINPWHCSGVMKPR